jgi:gamma-glutamyl:cysteine ligase YbdK (ATP-grasp superfamily)
MPECATHAREDCEQCYEDAIFDNRVDCEECYEDAIFDNRSQACRNGCVSEWLADRVIRAEQRVAELEAALREVLAADEGHAANAGIGSARRIEAALNAAKEVLAKGEQHG